MSGKFMVFVKGKSNPAIFHESEESAIKEAHRLAHREPEIPVILLQVKAQFIGRVLVEEIQGSEVEA